MPATHPPVGAIQLAFDTDRNVVVASRIITNQNDDDLWEFFDRPAVPGSYTLFGSGCAGTAGVPALQQPIESPRIGATFSIDATGVPNTLLASPIGLLGLSKQTWAGMPLPISLDSLGMTGCSALISVDDAVSLTTVGGKVTWSTVVPLLPDLAGQRFYQQRLLVNLGANPFGAVTSNAGEAVIGNE